MTSLSTVTPLLRAPTSTPSLIQQQIQTPSQLSPSKEQRLEGGGSGSASWAAAPSPHSHMVAHWLNISEGGLS